MSGKRMPKRMRGDSFVQTRFFDSLPDGMLESGIEHVVTPHQTRVGIAHQVARGKEPEPGPISAGAGVFSFQGLRQPNTGNAIGAVRIVKGPQSVAMSPQALDQFLRQNGKAILISLAKPDRDLAAV